MPPIARLVEDLRRDDWRRKAGFSPEMRECNKELLDRKKNEGQMSAALRRWLAKNQPCLFGRMAAGPADLISFCFLTDHDLHQSDRYIRDKLQAYRLQWQRHAFAGLKS